MGKLTVIKTFALPKLIYPLSVLSNPLMNVLPEIILLIFKFIWDNKPDKIKRNRLKTPISEGGLSVPDIFDFNRANKAGWIKRYLAENNNGNWKIILDQKLIKLGNTLLLESNLTEKDIKTIFKK